MSVSEAAVSFVERLPTSGKYFLYVSSTLALVGGGGYFLYKWLKGQSKGRHLERRRNTVELRKPPQLWNTAIFFPDYRTKDPNSKTAQLLWYFREAKISIQICIYNSSLKELEDVIFDKFREGLLVEVVTGNESTASRFRAHGIKVGIYPATDTEYLMHHKFVIFDSEAVMTGSLNWTLDGITANRENVVTSTDQRHVKKYLREFYQLMKKCEDANTVSYSSVPEQNTATTEESW